MLDESVPRRPGPRRAWTAAVALLASLALADAWGSDGLTPELRFTSIGAGTALERAQVAAICQDHRGFLWFGTRDNGLFRYDGYRLKQFVHDPDDPTSLCGNRVWALAVDRGGRLWVGTFGDGLSRFEPETERFVSFHPDPKDPGSLASDSIAALLVDGSGTLWIGTFGGGLDRLTVAAQATSRPTFRHLRHVDGDAESLGHDEVWTLIERGGTLWVGLRYAGLDRVTLDGSGTPTGIRHFRNDPADPRSLASDKVWCTAPGRDGSVWVGTFGAGLDRFDTRTLGATHVPLGLPGSEKALVRAVFEDSRGILWVAESEKEPVAGPGRAFFARVDARTLAVRLQPGPDVDPLAAPERAITVFEDAEGLLWFGTWGHGVFVLDPRTARFGLLRHHTEDPASLSSEAVQGVVEDERGRLWVATDHGVNLRTSGPGEPARFRRFFAGPGTGLRQDRVSCLYEDRDGTLWVAAGAIHTLDLSTFEADGLAPEPRFRAVSEEPGHPLFGLRDRVTSMLRDRQGTVWLGLRNQGLVRWQGTSVTRYRHDPGDDGSIAFDVVWSVFEDSTGAIWVGTENGLCRLDAGTGRFTRFLEVPGDPASLSGKSVAAIAEDSHGNLWVGTRNGGLNLFDRKTGRFRRVTEKQGLSSNVVTRIVVDRRDRLWLSTGRGLDRFDPATSTVARFDEGDGAQPTYFFGEFEGAALRGRDGRLYFGGPGGLNVFDPEEIVESPRRPPVVLTDFLLFNRSVAVSRAGPLPREIGTLSELTLDHTQDLFAIEFSALSFRRPSRNRFAYRLDGVNREWVAADAGDRKAVYTRLSPGRYVFRVKASNADGVWNEEGASLALTILPPWWLTWWFKSAVALAFVLAPVAWVRARTRRLVRHERELEQEVAARTRELVTKTRTIEEQAARLALQNEALLESATLQADVERMSRHDLKTPLTSIISIPKRLLARPGITPEEAGLLRHVELAGYRVLGLVNLSLDLFRMEKGTYVFQPKIVDLAHVLGRAVADLEPHAASKRVTIRTTGPDGQAPAARVPVHAEDLLTYSMLANLLKNAVEAAPEESTITLRFGYTGDWVSLTIHNRGAVPTGIRDRFFEKYSSAGKEGGTGLGTYSARLMAETQRGRIEMQTSETDGTSVTVFLTPAPEGEGTPAAPEPVDPERTTSHDLPRPLPPLPPLRVLLVDDEPGNLAVLRQALPAPLVLATAVNGRAALDEVTRFRPDVVVMDAVMPIMGGLEATSRIRAAEVIDPGRARITIIGLSSYDDPESRARMLDAGCDVVLQKPAEMAELIEVLRGVAPPSPPVALPGIDRASALRRLSGNEELLLELIGELKARHGDAAARVREALSNGDLTVAKRIAHTVRGAAANLSASDVATAARALESALSSGGDVEEPLERLARAFESLAPDVVPTTPRTTPPASSSSAPPVDAVAPDALERGLDELAGLLSRGSLEADALFQRLKPSLGGPGTDPAIVRLEEEIASLDHASAAATLAAMRRRR